MPSEHPSLPSLAVSAEFQPWCSSWLPAHHLQPLVSSTMLKGRKRTSLRAACFEDAVCKRVSLADVAEWALRLVLFELVLAFLLGGGVGSPSESFPFSSSSSDEIFLRVGI